MREFCLALSLSLGLWGSLFGQDLLSQQKAENLFNSGMGLMDHGQYGAAKENYEAYLVLPGIDKRIDAEYYIALCALNLYHQDAEKLIEEFVAAHPKHARSALAYFDLGNFYYANKNYKKAGNSFAKVNFSTLTQESQTTGRFRLGYSLFNLKQLDEALDQFNYVKASGGQYGPAAGYYAGFIEYSKGDFSNALLDLKKAEQNESYASIVPYMIANVYYKQNNYDELIRYATSIKDKEGVSNRDEISLLTAEAYYKKKDYKNALAGYGAYLNGREDKAESSILFRAGYAAFLLKEDEVALGYLKSASLDKDSVGYYSAYYLGYLHLKKNQKTEALGAFDVARRYLPDPRLVEESTYQFAKVSYDLGKPDQAISVFEKILAGFPNSNHADEIKELLSQAYVNANNYNRAIEYMEALATRSPAVDRAYQKATMLKGMELFNADNYDQAIGFLEKSLRYPIDEEYVAEASFWCGEAYSIEKNYDQAAGHYLKVIAISPGLKDFVLRTRYGLGYVYYNQQNYERALFNFKEFVGKANKDQPNYTDGVLRLADCYYISKSYPEALQYFEKAIQLRSSDSDYAYLQSGTILGIQSKYAQAAIQLDRVVKDFPQSAYAEEARFQKAQLDFEQGNYTSAISTYSNLILVNPSSKFVPYAYMRRAAAYYNTKDYSQSANDYIKVIENYSNHPISKDALVPLQESLSLAGRSSEFDKYLAQIKSSHPDAKGIESIEFEAAKNFYFNQDYNKATSTLASFIGAYPESTKRTEAQYYLAESYYRIKENAKALELYYQLVPDKSFSMFNKVMARVAEIEFKSGRYEKAVPYFHQLANLATNKKEQYNAWSGLMESHYLLAQYDSVATYSNLILEKGNVNAGAQNKASLYLGKAALAKGDYESAKDEFLNTLNSAHDEYGAEAKYLLAEIFFFNKENKQCFETLVSLNSDFAPYPEWVGKSFLLMADNYLSTGETFQAKATLKSLDQFPLQNIRDQAKEKLNKIDEEETKRKSAQKKDTVDIEKNK